MIYIWTYISIIYKYKNLIPPATFLQSFLTPGFINRSVFKGEKQTVMGNTNEDPGPQQKR